MLRLPSTVAFAVWIELQKHHIPYATEIVFDCYDGYRTSSKIIHKIIWMILHRLQVKACKNAIGVSCVTSHYLQQHYYPGSNGITSYYSSIEITPDFYGKPRIFPDKKHFKIIHVSNQVYYASRKGHNELIMVLSNLIKKGYEANVVFIGEDYCGGIDKLKEFAAKLGVSEYVSFTGFLSHEQLRSALLDADIALLPTRAEGLPRVIIEAMALGLPCITSPVSGNPELIADELLIEYNDINGMTNSIIKLMTDKELYEKNSLRNIENSKQYSTTVLNPRRTSFFNKLRDKVEHNYICQSSKTKSC